MRSAVLAVAAVLLLAACGAMSAGPGSGASPSPSSGLGFDVTATEKDHTAAMRVGQRLEVVLHAAAGMNDWSSPRSSDESILAPTVDPAATAARGVTLAAFVAKAPGQVDVTSFAGPVCASGQPCPMYVAAYTLRVTVSA